MISLTASWLFIEPDLKDGNNRDRFNFLDMIRRDKRRWALADHDNDGLLTKEEFADFLHPEESSSMKDVVVDVCLCCRAIVLAFIECL